MATRYQTKQLTNGYLIVTLTVDGQPTARLHGKPGSTTDVFTGADCLAQAERRHLERLEEDRVAAEAAAEAERKRIETEDLLRKAESIRTLPNRHDAFVRKHGKEYKGLTVWSPHKLHRTTHCYRCALPLASSENFECLTCGWMICNNCASCGCGFSR